LNNKIFRQKNAIFLCFYSILLFNREIYPSFLYFFAQEGQKSLLFMSLEAFAEGVGIDVPAEHL